MDQIHDVSAAGDNASNGTGDPNKDQSTHVPLPADYDNLKSVDHVEYQVELEKISHKIHELTPPPQSQSEQSNNATTSQFEDKETVPAEKTGNLSDTDVPTQNGDQNLLGNNVCQASDNSDNIPQTLQTSQKFDEKMENLDLMPTGNASIGEASPVAQGEGQIDDNATDDIGASKCDRETLLDGTADSTQEEIKDSSGRLESEVIAAKDQPDESVVSQTATSTSDNKSELDRDPSQSQILSGTEKVTSQSPKTSENGEVTDKGDNEPKVSSQEKEEECMDILGNGLLTKKILEAGAGRQSRPVYGDIVTIDAEGRLEDGTVVDSGTVTFTVGDGDVLQCWDMALPLIEMNEKCEVFSGSKYAYGALGRSPDIPKDADITFTLKLIQKQDPPNIDNLCLDDRMKMGEQKRERGNLLFSRTDFSGAINSYNKALKILDPESCNEEADRLQLLLESRLKCYNNMAACQLKVEAFDAAIRSCESVLKSQPQNVKALFRMGKAYAAKLDTKLAITFLKKALQLEPEAKVIHQELSKLTKKMKKEADDEKDMYRKMIGNTDIPEEKPKQSWWKWTAFMTATIAAMVSVGLGAYRYTQH
ncbi:hypothetical protein ScPMuIL_017860 [Solemya velum]